MTSKNLFSVRDFSVSSMVTATASSDFPELTQSILFDSFMGPFLFVFSVFSQFLKACEGTFIRNLQAIFSLNDPKNGLATGSLGFAKHEKGLPKMHSLICYYVKDGILLIYTASSERVTCLRKEQFMALELQEGYTNNGFLSKINALHSSRYISKSSLNAVGEMNTPVLSGFQTVF